MNASTPAGALAIPTLPITEIVPSPSNPRKRFDQAYLLELAESIKEHGMIQPITVRPMSVDMILEFNRSQRDKPDGYMPPRYEIVVGECRWRAAQLAGLVEIPAFWRELDDKQVLEIQVIENLQRRDVHPIEEADGYRILIDKHGYTAEQIGEKIGKSRSYVYGRMKLASLGRYGRELFIDGKIDASVALLIARIADEKDQEKTLKSLERDDYSGDGITFRNAKWKISNGFTIDLCQATFPTDNADLIPSAGSCADCPKRSGNCPELCPDIDSADVCTDTKCFEAKRQARQTQLLDNYAARKIPVHTGESAKEIASNGFEWSIDRSEHVVLDDVIDHDPEQRTYRQLLGDKAPVAVVVEVKNGRDTKLVELAEPTAIAKALKKAGIAPPVANDSGSSEEEDNIAKANESAAKQQKIGDDIDAEMARRTDLRQQIHDRLVGDDGSLNTDPVVIAIAIAALRQETDYSEFPEDLLKEFGFEVPAEFDENVELEKICGTIAGWPVGKVLALLARMFLHFEEGWVGYDHVAGCVSKAPGHDGIAASLGLLEKTEHVSPAETEAPVEEATYTLKAGDRVRIKNDLRGPNGKLRKCCGREGVVEMEETEGGYITVRVGPGKSGLIANLAWNEVEKIDPTIAVSTEEPKKAPAAKATDAWPFPIK